MGRKGGGTMTPHSGTQHRLWLQTQRVKGQAGEAMGSPMLTWAVSSCFNLEYTTLKSYCLILGFVNFKREINLMSATCNTKRCCWPPFSFRDILKISFICRKLWACSMDRVMHQATFLVNLWCLMLDSHIQKSVPLYFVGFFLDRVLLMSLRLTPNPGFPCLSLLTTEHAPPWTACFCFVSFHNWHALAVLPSLDLNSQTQAASCLLSSWLYRSVCQCPVSRILASAKYQACFWILALIFRWCSSVEELKELLVVHPELRHSRQIIACKQQVIKWLYKMIFKNQVIHFTDFVSINF